MHLVTAVGAIDVELHAIEAPMTVANVLNGARRGDDTGSFLHRLVPGFVLQVGSFRRVDTAAPRLSRAATAATGAPSPTG